MRRRECIVGAAGAVVVGSAPSLAFSQTTPGPLLFGLGLSINDKPMDRAVSLAAGLGVNSIRIDVPWIRVESPDGQLRMPVEFDAMVNECVGSNVVPLLILAYGHPRYGGDKPTSDEAVQAFSRYAAFVVQHFKGKVKLYDVWNEWSTHTGRTRPGSAEDYVRLVTAVNKAVKPVDSTVKLLSGGMSDLGLGNGWVDKFFELGGHKWIDGVSIHPYNWFYRNRRTPESAADIIDEVTRQLDAAGASQMPIYVTEIGWPNFSGRYGRTAAEVDSYMSRFMLLAASRPRVAGVWWYCLRDQGNDPTNKEHRFGLLDFDYNRKPVAARFQQLAEALRQNGRPTAQGDSSSGYRVQWRRAGAPAVSWRPEGEAAVPLGGMDKAER